MTDTLPCAVCGKPVPQTAVPAERAWCSPEHYEEWERARMTEPTNKLTIRECENYVDTPDNKYLINVNVVLRQLADTMRENERLRSAVSMLANESISPKQRRNILNGIGYKHSEKHPVCPICGGWPCMHAPTDR